MTMHAADEKRGARTGIRGHPISSKPAYLMAKRRTQLMKKDRRQIWRTAASAQHRRDLVRRTHHAGRNNPAVNDKRRSRHYTHLRDLG